MSSSESRQRRIRVGLLALATAAITAVTAAPASAAPATGTAKIVLSGSQSDGKLGNKQASLAVTDLDLLADGASATTRGTLKLRNGKHTAQLRRLELEAGGKEAAISAKLGKARLTFFRASGSLTIAEGSATLRNARLSLTSKGAAKLRQRLGLDELKAGEIGRFSLDATLEPTAATPAPTPAAPAGKPAAPPVVDPYAAQCGLPATSEAQGNVTPAAPAPALGGAPSLSEGTIGWGFRLSFREYVATIAGGSATAIAPATLVPPPPTPVQVGTFEFPASAGKYLANTSDAGDDQAVIDGEGEAVLCALHKGKGFRITLSNPTVIIDGEDSRLVVDIATNVTGAITAAQRVDVATIEPGDAEVAYDGGPRTVSWEAMPTKLTQQGLDAMQLCNPKAPSCVYNAGDALDPLTVEIVEPWGQAAACDLSGISPMPEPTVTPSWPAAPAAPATLPSLTSPLSVDSGAINWGLRNSLRGTIFGTGVFNLLDGATKSDAVMAGPGKFFTWPATSGEFEPGSPGRLVLHGKGTVGLCQIEPMQAYGTVLSDPTLVVDGANSRLVLNVSTLFRSSWTTFGPIDAISLDIGKVEASSVAGPGAGKETTTWTFPDPGADNTPGGTDDNTDSANSAVKLTATGTSGFWLLGNNPGPPSPYRTVGTGLNKVVVSVVHEEVE
ncbi:MAG: HtaA domain-containing protein [Solirubrobacterales bacterium]